MTKFEKMRTNTLKISILFIVATLFCSCKKEVDYQPENRISKVYHSYIIYDADGTISDQGNKDLYQTWHWGKDRLESIAHKTGRPYSFVYEGNKLKRITSEYEEMRFFYDGSELTTVEIESNIIRSHLVIINDIERDRKDRDKILKFTIYYQQVSLFKSRETFAEAHQNITKLIEIGFSREIAATMRKSEEFIFDNAKDAKMFSKYVFTNIYENDNVVERKLQENYSSNVMIYDFEYDNKPNAFYKMALKLKDLDLQMSPCFFSKNNVIKQTARWENSGKHHYFYEYDGDKVVVFTEKIFWEDGTLYFEETFYYEYEH